MSRNLSMFFENYKFFAKKYKILAIFDKKSQKIT